MKIKKRIDTKAVVIVLISDAEAFLALLIKDGDDRYGWFDKAKDRLELLQSVFYCDDMNEVSDFFKAIWKEMLEWASKYDNIVEASKAILPKIKDARYTIWDELKK